MHSLSAPCFMKGQNSSRNSEKPHVGALTLSIPEELNRAVPTAFGSLQASRQVFSTLNLGIRLAGDPALQEYL